jgi:iron(III) transport system substrate-binding protein
MSIVAGAFLWVALFGGASAWGASAPGGQESWDQIVAAAKKEGKVNVIIPVGREAQDALTEPFQKKYGIAVDFWADRGAGIAPRVSAERGARQYLWDVVVTGTTTALTALIPMKMLDPLEPGLVLPEVKDLKQWRGGALEFIDPGRQMLVMTPFQRGTLFVNPNLVKPETFKSYKDLLDPKWKGKIIMDDPRRAGPGQATFTFFHLHPELGPEFIRALGRQEPLILRDFAQEVDEVGRGKYPILLGTADANAEERMRQGIPIVIVDPRQLKEGSDVSPANGCVAIFNRMPHPSAAKVYLNWLLSKEGQTVFSRAMGYVSSRLDVPTDHALSWRVPQPGAIKTYDQQAVEVRAKLMPLLQEVFGR